MKLYDYHQAPSPRRVRMFIGEKGLNIPTVEVDLKHRAQDQRAFQLKNPRCTVPVLELDNGEFIWETLAICEYLEARFPDPPLIGSSPQQRARVLMWYQRIVEDGFMAVSESFRNFVKGFKGRALTGPVGYEQIPGLVKRGHERAVRFFEDLNAHLKGRQFIVDDVFSLADIAAIATVDFAKAIKLEISEQQNDLRRWHQTVSARPSAKL